MMVRRGLRQTLRQAGECDRQHDDHGAGQGAGQAEGRIESAGQTPLGHQSFDRAEGDAVLPEPESKRSADRNADGIADHGQQDQLDPQHASNQPGAHADGKQHAEFAGALEHRHQKRVEDNEHDDYDEADVPEHRCGEIQGDGLLERRLQHTPILDRQALGPSQAGEGGERGVDRGKGGTCQRDDVRLVAHGECLPETAQRHFGDLPVELVDAGVEDADQLQAVGGYRPVDCRSEKGDVVAERNLEIAGERVPENDRVGIVLSQIAALMNRCGESRDMPFLVRLDSLYRRAVAQFAVGEDDIGGGARGGGGHTCNLRCPGGELIGRSDCLANVRIVGVTGWLDLREAVKNPQSVGLHGVVDAKLEGQHEDQQCCGEGHAEKAEARPRRLPPQISPCRGEQHWCQSRGFCRLDWVKM